MPFSKTVDLENLHGHIAIPDKNSGIGLLLVHAWWGLNEFFKTLADHFATEGFVVFAPDFYNGKVATTIDEAENLSDKMDEEATATTLNRALDYLKQHPSAAGEKVGVMGVSLGAWFSVNLSMNRPEEIGAIVLFYGLGDRKISDFSIPIQGHFAEDDKYENTEDVKEFEMRVAEGRGECEFYTYPGTTHWFFESDVINAFHKSSANLAFERTIMFLKSHL
jgi:carboxymethylenebutenolidase